MKENIKNGDYHPIGNYGIIGNLHTIALVSLQGSIDFMPFTRIDSPTIFASILDHKKGGSFEIMPQMESIEYKQLYLPDSAVLLTRFLSNDGLAEITDYMPVKEKEKNCVLVRTVRTVLGGEITFRIRCNPRFDYARANHTVEKTESDTHEIIFKSEGADGSQIRLMSNVPLEIKEESVYAEFTLKEKEEVHFIIEAIPNENHYDDPLKYYNGESFYSTLNFWKKWIQKSTYSGRWREMVHRSIITLKLLTSYKYGSVVAAGTFGLPEALGGERNWDYRYTWIRDAAFTMYAFLKLGYMDEARSFIDWIKNEFNEIIEEGGLLQLMYAVDGSIDLEEIELPHLEGYMKSSPVRIGNGAYDQFQMDIFGELIDAIFLYNKYGGAITYDFWRKLEHQIEFVCNNWHKKDHGIWEIRNEEREFLHSRIMCWVALDRAIKLAEDRSFPSPINKWKEIRDEIYKDVYFNFFNEKRQAFVQYKGGDNLDAAALLMPIIRFISPTEPRWISTMTAIEEELVHDALVYRYINNEGGHDGLESEEGTFSMCTFWYVECLARSGQIEKARLYFEKMLGYANHLGLFAEQLGKRGEQLGNFPQAFTHLGLISAAIELDKDLSSWKSHEKKES
ncbi:MAG: glycoside hydrolase family 15 protein [Bacteroidota bacterium]|nr:glycoside hydrolase family 15 protein [Bacteroidota bacterium]